MLYIVIWLVKRIVEKFPSRYRAAILCQHTNLTFYSSFEENCQQIKLTAEEISPLKKINTENKKLLQTNPRSQRIASKK